MNEVYQWIGIVVFWVLLGLTASALLFGICLLGVKIYRLSWIYSTFQVIKVWYKIEYKKMPISERGLQLVRSEINRGDKGYYPYRKYYIALIERHLKDKNLKP